MTEAVKIFWYRIKVYEDFQSIGWEIDFINGNNEVEIRKSLTKFNSQANQNLLLLLVTIKGLVKYDGKQ